MKAWWVEIRGKEKVSTYRQEVDGFKVHFWTIWKQISEHKSSMINGLIEGTFWMA